MSSPYTIPIIFSVASGAAAATYGFFLVLEKFNFSAEFRGAVAENLKEFSHETMAKVLDATIGIFNRIFGEKHLSWKCIRRSLLLSVFANVFAFVLVILLNPKSQLLSNDDSQADLIDAALWCLLAAIPDYLNLYKTRIVMGFIANHKTSSTALLLTALFVDVSVGLVVFNYLFEVISSLRPLWGGDMDFSGLAENLFALPEPAHLLWLLYNADYQSAFFYTSMIPSIWFWTVIGSLLIGRLLFSGRTVISFLRKAVNIDIDGAPLQSLGTVAAGLVFVAVTIWLTLTSIFLAFQGGNG